MRIGFLQHTTQTFGLGRPAVGHIGIGIAPIITANHQRNTPN